MRYYLSSLFLMISLTVFAQELQVKGTTINPSKIINDGEIDLEVTGGVPPYTYRWSNQETPLTSNKSTGLVEGVPYTVMVTDANGLSETKAFTVKAKAITEIFNGFMTPAVNALGSFLFWDPFAAVGLHDPIAYADYKMVGIPDWTPSTEGKFTLTKWLQPEGAKVKKGDPVALISMGPGDD